jgi:hypothetical protein
MTIPAKTIAKLKLDSRVTLVYDGNMLTITLTNNKYNATASKVFDLDSVDNISAGISGYNDLKSWLGPACRACKIEGLCV